MRSLVTTSLALLIAGCGSTPAPDAAVSAMESGVDAQVDVSGDDQAAPDAAVDAQTAVDVGLVDASTADSMDAAPAIDTPAIDTPAIDTPAIDTPTADTPTADTPTADRPPVDTPTVDTPTIDMPTADRPPVDAPSTDVPTVDGSVVSRCGTAGTPSWALENPAPIDQPFTGLHVVAADDIYLASSELSAARRWNGTAFEPLGPTGPGGGVWAASATDVFLPSGEGILRGRAGAFTLVHPGGSYTAIHGANASAVFAAGRGGRVARWDGSTWTTLTPGTTLDFSAVFAVRPDDVWASTGGGESGTALWHFDGSAWRSYQPMPGSTIHNRVSAIWGSGPDDVYFCFTSSPVRRWNGTSFETILSAQLPAGCTGVSGTSATDVWFVGRSASNGYVHRYDGTTLTHPWTASDPLLRAVHAASPTRVAFAGEAGLLATWDGAGFSVRSPSIRDDIGRVWVAPTGEVYAQGQGGVYFGDCGAWSRAPGVPGDRGDVTGLSATQVWFGATGGVRRVNGAAFSVGALEPYGIGASTDITYGIWAQSPVQVFAAGSTANTEGMPSRNWVRSWDGIRWRDITPSMAFNVRRVTGFSATEVYVTGVTNGTVLRYDGLTWRSESIGVGEFVRDLVALDGNVLLAVTLDPRNSRRRAPSGLWSTAGYAGAATAAFQRSAGTSERSVFSTRSSGIGTYLWQWDGAAWIDLPIRALYLDDVSVNAAGDAVAVGTLGRVWRYGRRR
jgi:hypothetical protein